MCTQPSGDEFKDTFLKSVMDCDKNENLMKIYKGKFANFKLIFLQPFLKIFFRHSY